MPLEVHSFSYIRTFPYKTVFMLVLMVSSYVHNHELMLSVNLHTTIHASCTSHLLFIKFCDSLIRKVIEVCNHQLYFIAMLTITYSYCSAGTKWSAMLKTYLMNLIQI